MKKYTLSITPFVVILLFILLQHLALQSLAQKVGIGTTNPAFKLDVNNGSINTDSVYRIGGNTVLSVKGINNVFVGVGPGEAPLPGVSNTAVGAKALSSNTTGESNTAVGAFALNLNNGGYLNTAIGGSALTDNVSGHDNTAIGFLSQLRGTESYNTSVGAYALSGTFASQYNTAVGYSAGDSYNNGYNNVFIGANSDVNGAGYYNVIAIGQGTVVGASNRAVFGNPATVFYGGWTTWSSFSDGRFKADVAENVPGVAFIKKLRPVTYTVKATELDAFLHKNHQHGMAGTGKTVHAGALHEKEAITYTGFVAQEVEAAAGQLGFNFSGVEKPKDKNDTYGLRYAEFVVPLVKAVQEQQGIIEELKNTNTTLQKDNEELKARLEKVEKFLAGKY